jgi:opacity protein-like surface antigen
MHNSLKTWLCPTLLLVMVLPASSQIFSVGVKGGIPMTDAYSTGQSGSARAFSYDRRYIVGPTAEIHLPFHLSFEVDALYRRNGFQYESFFRGFSSIRTSVNDWQFPFLGKYEFGFGPFKPFVDAGVVYRHVTASSFPVSIENPNSAGFTVGGGITLKLLFLRLSPEIRYSYWPSRPYTYSGPVVWSSQNQADFLVGLTF